MKAIFTLLLLSLTVAVTAQRVTVDTSFVGWNAMVTYDPSKTDSSECIIYFPGAGEVGTNIASLLIYGPHYWLNQGWDGGVQLGNGVHYPIYISLQPPSQSVLEAPNIKQRLDAILARYKIKTHAFYLTGPSAGGFASWTYVTYQPTAGDHTGYGDRVTAIMCPESVKPNQQQGATPAYPANTVQWIGMGNKWALGFNQINDGGRDMQTYYAAMSAVAPNNVTYYNTDFGGGTHCCFQEFWDPSNTDWSSSSLSTSLPVGAGVPAGWNTYQWLLRKGDTSLSSAPAPLVANANAANQVIVLPSNTANLNAAGSTGNITGYSWTKISGGTATITTPAGATTTVTALTAGTYVFQLAITNGTATATSQVTVIVDTPPTADAGANQTITLPVSLANLTGVASVDPDGTIASYAWTQVSGPSTAIMVGGATATPVVSTLVAGTYIFQLTVTDNNGATSTAQVKVVVNPALNQPPVANAGSGQTITLPVSSATLNGSASYDPDGTIASYAWAQVSGPSTAVITGGTTSGPVVSALVAGTYVFKLTVTDNSGATATAQVSVIVNAAVNQPPVANAGVSQTITLPTSSASLDGSGSSDPDGTIASYAWTQVSGPSTAVLTGGTTAIPAVSALVAGTYIFQLTVTDNSGATASAQVKIIVNAASPVPVANAGANQTITLPTSTVTLSGSASQGEGGTISGYTWSQVSGPGASSIVSAGAMATVVNSLQQGQYVFQLLVTDNDGKTATDQVTVTVNAAANQPPVANAGSGQTITLPTSSVTLTGSASYDPDGTIASYAWIQVSGPSTAVIASGATATPVVSALAAGTYVFQLMVTDNSGATATAQVTVVVNAAANVPPVANAGSSQTITLPTSSVTLNGSASTDADGTITVYQWALVAGPSAGVFGSGGSVTTTVGGLVQGTYIFRLTVTDSHGLTSTDDVTVVVNPEPHQPPVANAGTDQTVVMPASSVGLNGTASYSPDGTIVSYSWVEVAGLGGVTIVNSNSATPTIYGLQPGTYVFQLTVTDNEGATATAEVTIVTHSAPPASNLVANAGKDTTVSMKTDSVVLSGALSTDSGSAIVSYQWAQVGGTSEAVIGDPSAAVSNINGLQPGIYTFRLTVQDELGNTDTADVTVTVVDVLRSTGSSLLVYPNPAQAMVNIDVTNPAIGNTLIEICDLSGRVLMRIETQKTDVTLQQSLNISQLARGVYFIKIVTKPDSGHSTGPASSIVTKLVKQ